MAAKKKESKGYQYALTGGKVILRLLLIVLAIVILLAIAKLSYTRGYTLFETREQTTDSVGDAQERGPTQ